MSGVCITTRLTNGKNAAKIYRQFSTQGQAPVVYKIEDYRYKKIK